MMKRLLLLVSIFMLSLFGILNAQTINPGYIDGHLYFKFNDDYDFRIKVNENTSIDFDQMPAEFTEMFERYGVTLITRPLYAFNDPKLERILRLEFTDAQNIGLFIKELEMLEDVEYAEMVPYCTRKVTYNDPYYTSRTVGGIQYNFKWHLEMIKAPQAWGIQQGSSNIKVAIVDNAVWGNHPDLQIASSNQCSFANGTASVGNSAPPSSVSQSTTCSEDDLYTNNNCPAYDWSHGTHCAGLVGAINNNGVGISSIGGGVTLMGVRAANNQDQMYYCMNGVTWAVQQGAKVVSMSYGSTQQSTSERTAFQTYYNNGVILVAAAGNEGDSDNSINYPGGYSTVISVASVNNNGKLSSFSQHGTGRADVAAPGGFVMYQNQEYMPNILSTTYCTSQMLRLFGLSLVNGEYYDGMQGTSMATPITAGLCGLLASAYPDITPAQAKQCLISTGTALASGSNTIDNNVYINAYAAVQCAQSYAGSNTLSVSPASLNYAVAGGSQTVTVTSNTSWTATSSASWLTISPASGSNNGTITAVAAENTATSQRIATITVSGTDAPTQTISVTQAGTSGGGTFTYDFEACTAWTVDQFSPCTTYDGDGSATGGIQNVEFDNQGYTGSYIVFENGLASSFTAHGGTKFGCCMYASPAPNNDWFITPAISISNGTTFSFWARSANNSYGLEQFKVAISTNNTTFSTYLAGSSSTSVSAPVEWTQYTYDLSSYAGQTMYIAIMCVSNDVFAFFIDDIEVSSSSTPSYNLTVSPSSLSYTAAGESKTVTVTSNTSWTATSSASWLTISPASGSNNGTITAVAAANTSTSQRTATITVSGTGVSSQTISVTQAGESGGGTGDCVVLHEDRFTANPSIYTVEDGGYVFGSNSYGDQAKAELFELSGNYNLTSIDYLYSIDGSSGSVTFKVWANSNGTPGSTLATKTVTMSELYNAGTSTGSGTTKQGLYTWTLTSPVAVSSNFFAGIDVSSATSYIGLASTAEGSGYSNSNYELYNGSWGAITTSWQGLDASMYVLPTVCPTSTPSYNLTVNPSSLSYTAAGESKTVTVTSNTSWTVTSSANWLTVSPASGSNSGTITAVAAANTSSSQRTATITVSGTGVSSQTISVTQAGVSYNLTVSPSSLSYAAAGESKTVTVTSNTSWTATSSASWLTVSPASGSNNGTITAVAAANTSTSQRTATITVSGSGITRTVSVTQDGATSYTLTVSPSSLSYVAAGESKTVTVTSNTSWTATSSASWLTVSPASGSNNGTITAVAAANTSTSQRTATITVSGSGITRTVSVTQDGATSYTLTVSPSSLSYVAAGESKTVTVTSNTSWTATSSASWLTVSPASGSNNGTITAVAAANTSTSQRTATITVSGSGVTRTVSVTQDGAISVPTYTITAIANNNAFGTVSGGGTYQEGETVTLTAVPNSGYVFTSWNNGSTANPLIFTATENVTYIATFENENNVTMYTITVESSNNQMGTVTGGGRFAAGTTITIEAHPNEHFRFVHWQDGNTDNPREITVNSNATYTASFEAIPQYTITATAGLGGAINPNGGVTVYEGDDKEFIITADEGYRIKSVTVDGNESLGQLVNNVYSYNINLTEATYTFTNITNNHTISARFEAIPQYTITVLANPTDAGIVSGGGTYYEGTVVTVEAAPYQGYVFNGWDDNNMQIRRTITVTGNATYTANFVDASSVTLYTITVTSDNNLFGTATGSGTYAEGTEVTIEAIPNSGYRFSSWNNGQITDNPYTIIVTRDENFVAYFTENTGIEEELVSMISVFPNPTSGMFTVELSSIEGNVTCQIVNARGSVVETREIEAMGDSEYVFDLNVASGVYFVRIISGYRVWTERIIIEK